MPTRAQEVHNPVNTVEEQIIVKDTTLPDQIFSLIRVLGVLFGLGTAMLGFLKTRDLAGLISFVKANDVVAIVSGAIGLAALIYGNLKMRWNKKKLITASASASNVVAKVVK
jgi:hypothetical protein